MVLLCYPITIYEHYIEQVSKMRRIVTFDDFEIESWILL